ncbi:SGNH/GDSL hydrolase family protein [Pseudonocardia pini]|uniref:SGNH/GDSL hydrolase family protein n=1 Tax=Pseudonocardia pini TaxID=2758030 RepID=UPI0015F002C7|nr:GDSL-type esterase/lipase family protein [Pseudonocardia pini]
MADSRLTIPANPRIAVLGDSLAAGLGVRENSYPRLLAKDLQAEAILMKAKASRRVDECTELVPRLDKFKPDLVLISTGQTESLVHPPRFVEEAIERHGPENWKGVVGLDARPYYSEDRAKRAREIATTVAKIVVKNVTIRLAGGYPRMPHDEYRRELTTFLDLMEERGWPVVVAGVGFPNAVLYPRSKKSLATVEQLQQELIATRPNARYLRLNGLVDFARDTLADRCHPSVAGHRKIADAHHALLDVVPRVDAGPVAAAASNGRAPSPSAH